MWFNSSVILRSQDVCNQRSRISKAQRDWTKLASELPDSVLQFVLKNWDYANISQFCTRESFLVALMCWKFMIYLVYTRSLIIRYLVLTCNHWGKPHFHRRRAMLLHITRNYQDQVLREVFHWQKRMFFFFFISCIHKCTVKMSRALT